MLITVENLIYKPLSIPNGNSKWMSLFAQPVSFSKVSVATATLVIFFDSSNTVLMSTILPSISVRTKLYIYIKTKVISIGVYIEMMVYLLLFLLNISRVIYFSM